MAVPGAVELTAVSAAAPAGRRTPRARVDAVRNWVLNIAATGGVICIACVVAALFFHVTLIMFKTGSMAPTIPAGSLAVVREIPAVDAVQGQVVTVDRPGLLPVTHRVVSVHVLGGDRARLVLKGDANATPDPRTYDVSHVRLVIWSAPSLAYVVVWLSNPVVIGSITVGVTALVVWVFWPAPAQHGRRRSRAAPSRLEDPSP